MATKTIPTASRVMLIKVKRLRRTMSHQERPLASGIALPPSLARRARASDSLRPAGVPSSGAIAAPFVATAVCAIISLTLDATGDLTQPWAQDRLDGIYGWCTLASE